MKIYYAIPLMTISLSSLSWAEGLSSYEMAGIMDAYIQVCKESYPDKADEYEKKILTGMSGFSCDRKLTEMEVRMKTEESIKEFRESTDPQIKAAYEKAFNSIIEPIKKRTIQEKAQACDFVYNNASNSKC